MNDDFLENDDNSLTWPTLAKTKIDPTTVVGDQIDSIVDHVLVLDNNPQLDDALIQRLQYDLATKTHTYETIARRYGLTSVLELYQYLKDHPNILAEAKKLRALFDSDEGIEARVRTRFLHATESLIAPLHNLVADIRTPISARIDGFKQIQRGAGVDGAPPRDARGGTGNAGVPFQLNILFTNGQNTTISGTTVLDADEIPPPPGDSEDDHFQEQE